MTIKDAVDLLFAARERIDFYWNFYVVIVIAVVGWIVTRDKPLSSPAKLLVTVAFVVAAVTSLAGLNATFTLAEALRTDVLRMTAGSPLSDTRAVLAQHSYLTQRTVAYLVHALIGASILFVIWRGTGQTSSAAQTAASKGS